MADKKTNPQELSFGKQMTSLLIVKNMRSNPKEVLKGVAFIAFICFFLFSFMFKGCQREAEQPEPAGPSSQRPLTDQRLV